MTGSTSVLNPNSTVANITQAMGSMFTTTTAAAATTAAATVVGGSSLTKENIDLAFKKVQWLKEVLAGDIDWKASLLYSLGYRADQEWPYNINWSQFLMAVYCIQYILRKAILLAEDKGQCWGCCFPVRFCLKCIVPASFAKATPKQMRHYRELVIKPIVYTAFDQVLVQVIKKSGKRKRSPASVDSAKREVLSQQHVAAESQEDFVSILTTVLADAANQEQRTCNDTKELRTARKYGRGEEYLRSRKEKEYFRGEQQSYGHQQHGQEEHLLSSY